MQGNERRDRYGKQSGLWKSVPMLLLFILLVPRLAWCGPPQKWALLIGIDKYQDRNRINDLSSATRDARALKETLIQVAGFVPDHIKLLVSDATTGTEGEGLPERSTILRALNLLARNVQPDDLVFVAFSGHGMVVGDKSYLLPLDADAVDEATLTDTSIETTQFHERLKRVPARLLVLAFDMCRTFPLKSGREAIAPPNTLTKTQVRGLDFDLPSEANGSKAPQSVVTLYSCAQGQQSFEWVAKQRSYFSYFLEEGLRGKAADATGAVHLDDLQAYLAKVVPTTVEANEHQTQTPFVVAQGAITANHMVLAGKGSVATPALTTPAKASAVTDTRARLKLTLSPTSARVTVDGVVRTGNLLVVDVGEAKTKQIELAVSAEGYTASIQRVTVTRGTIAPLTIILMKRNRKRPLPVAETLTPNWRAAAQDRIEWYRKGNVVVTVKDSAGKRLPDATVRIVQKRHAFRFGGLVNTLAGETGADADRYRATIARLFNYVLLPIGWNPADTDRFAQIMNWCRDNDLLIHGHYLFNGQKKNLPVAIQELRGQPLKEATETRVRDLVTRFKDGVVKWDAAEEIPDANTLDATTHDLIWKTFQWAHEINPGVELALNDYLPSNPANAADIERQSARIERTVKEIRANGGPITSIGLETWLNKDTASLPGENLLRVWDRISGLGVPIEISELIVLTPDDAKQATILEDALIAAFSHPRIDGLVLFGFWESTQWDTPFTGMPYPTDGALFHKDWSPRPVALVYERKVFTDWWTTETGTTGKDGQFSTRAFLGKYEITVFHNGRTTTKTLDVTQGEDSDTNLEIMVGN